MSRSQVSISRVLGVMKEQMPNLLSQSHTEHTSLMVALRGMGFKGWDKILNPRGKLRGIAKDAFEDDDINIYFQEDDFVGDKSEAWTTVVELLRDRGSMLDSFIKPSQPDTIADQYCEPSALDTGRISKSLEKRKADREITGGHIDEYQRRGYERIISLDESDELSRLPTTAPKNPRMGQMWLSKTENRVYVWNGKQWMDSGDRVNEESRY